MEVDLKIRIAAYTAIVIAVIFSFWVASRAEGGE